MYDTLQIWIPTELIPDPQVLHHLDHHLSDRIVIASTTATTVRGGIKNLRVLIKPSGVFIEGSICKYHFGNNQQTLTLSDATIALANLAFETGLPLHLGSVYRIDLATNYIMQSPVSTYLDTLGPCTYYNRLQQDNGLYYRCKRRQLLLYDKVAEVQAKHGELIDEYVGENVLRYEMQLKKKIPEQTSVAEVTVAHLVDPVYYKELLLRYEKEFIGINKIDRTLVDFSQVKDGKDLLNLLLQAGVNACGGIESVLRQIDDHRGTPYFEGAHNRMRLKKKIKDVFTIQNSGAENSHLSVELAEKVHVHVAAEIQVAEQLLRDESNYSCSDLPSTEHNSLL